LHDLIILPASDVAALTEEEVDTTLAFARAENHPPPLRAGGATGDDLTETPDGLRVIRRSKTDQGGRARRTLAGPVSACSGCPRPEAGNPGSSEPVSITS
jgi:hypothetical protein